MSERQDADAVDRDTENPSAINNLTDSATNSSPDADEEDKEITSLSQDTYGLLLISNPNTIEFKSSLFVCFFQITLIVMITHDLLTSGGIGDPLFNPPSEVSYQVQVGQCMALIISVLTQSDIVEAIELLVYSPSILAEYTNVHPTQILIVNVMHFVVGCGGLFIVFLAVVQADELIDLFSNFAAMEFVSNIDEIFFQMANLSYFGSNLVKKTEDLKKIEIPSIHRGVLTKQIFLFLPAIVIFSLWIPVVLKTFAGQYLAPSYTVSIPDNYDKNDSYLSGIYNLTKCTEDKRFTYVRDKTVVKENGDSMKGVIAYCKKTQTWVLNYYITTHLGSEPTHICDQIDDNSIYDPCKNIVLRSPRTKKYTFEEFSPSQWSIKVPTGGFAPVPSFFNYMPNECYQDRDCSNLHGSGKDGNEFGGICIQKTNTCSCGNGRFGVLCEHPKPCLILHEENLDEESNGVISENDEIAKLVYDKSLPFYFNDRPVYIQSIVGNVYLTLYQGVRYIQYGIAGYELAGNEVTDDDIVTYFKTNTTQILKPSVLNPSNSTTESLLSEQTDAGSPAGLDWYVIVSDAGIVTKRKGGSFGIFMKAPVRYACPDCDIVGISCGFSGECVNNTCNCSNGYSGSLCQIWPDFSETHNETTFMPTFTSTQSTNST